MEHEARGMLPLTGKEILVVEDDPLLRKRLTAYLKQLGAETAEADRLAQAVEKLESSDFDFVLLDIHLPDGNGLELLRQKRFPAACGVVVITGDGGIRSAVEAMKLGASEYLVKPFDFSELPLVFARSGAAVQQVRIQEHRRKNELKAESGFYFGTSLADLHSQLTKIIETDALLKNDLPPILISGETGTGKTAIARWIHYQGPRSAFPLIEINCSTLTRELAESELFGHERGAFTDAKERRIGLFEAAHQGTLFLDEIASLAPAVQSKVLTVIEDHKIRRVGGTQTYPVDTRIIAAGMHDLLQGVKEGQFREDLYHRLDLLRIHIPPLRERGADILNLAGHLLVSLRQRYRKTAATISPQGEKRVLAHNWPGNVRELAHEIERALILEEDGPLYFNSLALPAKAFGSDQSPVDDWLNQHWTLPDHGFFLEKAIDRLIQLALQQTQNNVSAAARKLNVPRDYIRYRLKKLKP